MFIKFFWIAVLESEGAAEKDVWSRANYLKSKRIRCQLSYLLKNNLKYFFFKLFLRFFVTPILIPKGRRQKMKIKNCEGVFKQAKSSVYFAQKN